jgi:DNA helicase HerA-like ATPase
MTAATGPLVDYVKRGRDAGLSLIFATQQPSAVNSKLMSQVDITITHTLGFETDLSAAVARMPTRTSVEYEIDNQKVSALSDVLRSLRPGEAVIADGASGRVFIAKMRPRVSAHGGATPT